MYIYLTVNLVTGHRYIGKCSKPVELSTDYLGSGLIIKRAIQKYGKSNFHKIILQRVANADSLNTQEIYWIDYYDAVNSNKFYNLLSGGTGGDHYTSMKRKAPELYAAAKLKMSNSLKNHYANRSEERIEKDREMARNKKITTKLVYQFDISGQLIRTFYSLGEAVRLYGGSKGALSLAAAGNRNTWKKLRWSFTNIPHPIKNRKKRSNKKNGPQSNPSNHANIKTFEIHQCDLDGTILNTFDSPRRASIETSLSQELIRRASKTNRVYRNFIWKRGRTIKATIRNYKSNTVKK